MTAIVGVGGGGGGARGPVFTPEVDEVGSSGYNAGGGFGGGGGRFQRNRGRGRRFSCDSLGAYTLWFFIWVHF